MILNFYMFCPRMQCRVFQKTNKNFIITKYRNFNLIDVVIFKLVLYPKELSTQLASNEVITSTCALPFKLISSIVGVATYPSVGGQGEIKRASSHEENEWSRHQCLFEKNVRKTKKAKVYGF